MVMAEVSRRMPKNDSEVAGPSIFSFASDIPRPRQVSFRTPRLYRHSGEVGCPKVRKSSM